MILAVPAKFSKWNCYHPSIEKWSLPLITRCDDIRMF